jgi:hypothetical protein
MSASWSIPVLGCFRGRDVGLNCCIQQTCCQPCVWASALDRAGVSNPGLLACLVCVGGRGILDEFAGYAGRRALVEKYKIDESPATTALLECACGPCARCQEIDTVMTRENLAYDCARLRPASTGSARSAPAPVVMVRPGGPRGGSRV